VSARRVPPWSVALLGLLWALVAWAPASWLGDAVGALSGQRLLLAEAQGNWRDGTARLVLAAGHGGRDAAVAPGLLHWRIGLGELWHGRIGLALRWDGGADTALQLALQLRPGGWALTQSAPDAWQARIPAALLQGLGTPWNTLALQGTLLLELRGASLESADARLRLGGRIDLQANALSSRLSPLDPLGSYRVQLRGEGASAALTLSTHAGPLLLDGTGVWNGRQLQFAGIGRAAPGQEQALANLLNLLGQRDGAQVRIAL
jgi:general secretion pathway protein N